MLAVIPRDILQVLRVTNQYRQKRKTLFFFFPPWEISSKKNKNKLEISGKKGFSYMAF